MSLMGRSGYCSAVIGGSSTGTFVSGRSQGFKDLTDESGKNLSALRCQSYAAVSILAVRTHSGRLVSRCMLVRRFFMASDDVYSHRTPACLFYLLVGVKR